MLIAALALNILILTPVIAGLAFGNMDGAFGPDTDARRILACVYVAIAVLSAALIVLHVGNAPWAVPMTLSLFAVQITYKVATVVAVGLSSPVILTNVVVVAVQCAAVAAWLFARG